MTDLSPAILFDEKMIQRMNEADVRAQIIDPLIRWLGYSFGSEFYWECERSLSYPYSQIGHRSKKDLPRGACDYICGVDARRGSFVLDAKRGDHTLSQLDREQAHSYAAHPEIGANFYVLCNGQEIRVYRTLDGLELPPIVALKNSEFVEKSHSIEALLSPEAVQRHSVVEYDTGKRIGQNLGSKEIVKNGWIILDGYDLQFDCPDDDPVLAALRQAGLINLVTSELDEMIGKRQPIEDGNVFRDTNGRIIADLQFGSYVPERDHNMQAIGLKTLQFITDSEYISGDPAEPSLFETESEHGLTRGTEFYSPIDNRLEAAAADTDLKLLIRGQGHINDRKFIGSYDSHAVYNVTVPLGNFPSFQMRNYGAFHIQLSA